MYIKSERILKVLTNNFRIGLEGTKKEQMLEYIKKSETAIYFEDTVFGSLVRKVLSNGDFLVIKKKQFADGLIMQGLSFRVCPEVYDTTIEIMVIPAMYDWDITFNRYLG